jgi:hypothetical protein
LVFLSKLTSPPGVRNGIFARVKIETVASASGPATPSSKSTWLTLTSFVAAGTASTGSEVLSATIRLKGCPITPPLELTWSTPALRPCSAP